MVFAKYISRIRTAIGLRSMNPANQLLKEIIEMAKMGALALLIPLIRRTVLVEIPDQNHLGMAEGPG
jgi:hypothetical protein